MNSPLAQLEYLWSGGDVLKGGSAPNCWKQELSRHTHGLTLISRMSDWVSTFAAQHACLLDQPLFGNSLQELTSFIDDPQSVPAPTERPKSATHFSTPERRAPDKPLRRFESPRFDEKATRGPSRIRLSPNQRSEVARRGETDVSHLGRQVERSILKRLAGTLVEADMRTVNPPNHVVPRRNGSSASPFRQSLQAKEWSNLIALRAAKTWLRNWPPSAARTSRHSEFLNQFSKQIPIDSPLLGDQWSTQLSGPEISRAVLDHLVIKRESAAAFAAVQTNQLRSDAPGSDNSTARRKAPNGDAARHPKHLSANDNATSVNTEYFDRIFSENQRRVGFPELDRGIVAGQDQFAARNQHELPASLDILPPGLSSSLPPLVPASSAVPTAPPIAANTASEWSWHNEAAAQDKDLNVLAAQIKRILDDEARRHGIDV